jgi:SpoVK/Ycf46/Vps4 family AAA+-type ATPase
MLDGFSGREIERFCKEVTGKMIAEMNREIPQLVDRGLEHVKRHRIKVRPLVRADFEEALRNVRPQTTPEQMQRYLSWKENCGG